MRVEGVCTHELNLHDPHIVQYCHMDQTPDQEWAAIIDGCLKWDRSSQNALYRRFYACGMGICMRYVDNEADGISILNDSYLKVFKHLHKYDRNQPFLPWFRKIVANTAISHLRRNKKFNLEMNVESIQEPKQEEPLESLIPYHELLKMIQSLSNAYRTVFNLYVMDGFKHEEIAQELGINVATSKSNLARARARLREMVTDKLKEQYG